MITIARFTVPEEAHLLRMRLESGGVQAFLQDENLIQTDLLYSQAVGGVRLQIAEEDLEAARALLEGTGLLGNTLACPECKSIKTELTDSASGKQSALKAFLREAFPIFFSAPERLCQDCGHRWKS